VEGEVGYFCRNHWVPVPVASDLAALNRKLFEDCQADESRIVSGRTETVGTRLLAEKEHLLPLATDVFDLAEVSFPRVDQTGCAKVRTNSYSVPLKPGSIVEARVFSATVEFRHHGKRIASHERCYSRLQKIFDLEHYLDVLDRKPGALRGSTPLAQWRAQGRWPDSYDRLWEQLTQRQGRQSGTRAMVTLIRMGQEFGYEKLTARVEQARDLGCGDVAGIRHLLLSDQLQHTVGETTEIGALSCIRTSSADHDRVRSALLRRRSGGAGMSLQTASIAQNCKALRLAAVGAQFVSLAEEAGQRKHSHLHYLEALLQSEMDDRERRSIELRMKEAHLPRIKTKSSTSLNRRTSRPPASAPWPKAAISNAPSRSCCSEIPAPARVILPPAWLSLPVGSVDECALRLPLRWSTSSSRHSGSRA
jgi:hypothetical protein